jgi:hypothetical protein
MLWLMARYANGVAEPKWLGIRFQAPDLCAVLVRRDSDRVGDLVVRGAECELPDLDDAYSHCAFGLPPMNSMLVVWQC